MGDKRINAAITEWVNGDGSHNILARELGISTRELALLISGLREWNWEQVVTISRLTGRSLNSLSGYSQ